MPTPRAHFVPASLTFLASTAAFLFAGAASAGQSCAADTQCPTGFSCQVVGGTACPAYACAPGTNCPAPPPCDPMVIKECRPGPCATNADCATGMVCFAQTETSCPPTSGGPACPPNADCAVPVPDPAPCTTTTVKSCVPQYALPCTLDINCGDGFTCVPDQTCGCSGSGGTGIGGTGVGGAPSNGTDPAPKPEPAPPAGSAGSSGTTPPLPPDCSCTTLPTNHCEARKIICASASNCPSQWSCVATRSGGATCAGSAAPADGGVAPPPVCTPVPEPQGPSTCMPPYYDLGFGIANDVKNSATPGVGGGANGTGTPPQGQETGTGGVTGEGPGDSHASAAGSSSSNDSGGCQMGTGHTSSNASALLALVGFLGLARRRRAS